MEKITNSDCKKLVCSDVIHIYSNRKVQVPALRGINFTFLPGKIYVIYGPSGSGKTTFLKILGGLISPTSGSINFLGKKIDNMEKNEKEEYRLQNISFILQDPISIPFLTVEENLKFILANNQKEVNLNKISAILEKIGIVEKKKMYPDSLSGGQKERLNIAIALGLDNVIWLCDEPTGSLDIENKRKIMDIFKQIIREDQNKIIIIVSHDLMFKEIADTLIFLRDGSIDAVLEKDDFDYDKNLKMLSDIEHEIVKTYQQKKISQKMKEISEQLR